MANRFWLWLALIAGTLLLLQPAVAQDGRGGIGNPTAWLTERMDWANSGHLPRDSELVAPICAHYNLAYDAPVLGLNLREPNSDRYWAVIAYATENDITLLDSYGPLEAPVSWDIGPYHLAFGTSSKNLLIWFTFPRQDPQLADSGVFFSEFTPFDCKVLPPNPITSDPSGWTVILSYVAPGLRDEIHVSALDGNGNLLGDLPVMGWEANLQQLVYGEFVMDGGSFIPWVSFATPEGYYIAACEDRSDWTSQQVLRGDFTHLATHIYSGGHELLVLVDETTEDYEPLTFHHYELISPTGSYLTPRWQGEHLLDRDLGTGQFLFLDSPYRNTPLIFVAAGYELTLLRYEGAADSPGGRINYTGDVLYRGEVRVSGSGDAARYPFIDLAGCVVPQSGYPLLYWIQLGDASDSRGLLYTHRYEPLPAAGG